jgi:glycosyltransferase involved in cell wall biosynthesis
VRTGRVDASARLTVFVGLYNSLPYFDHLVQQIEAQTARDVHWLFVDNASADDTWARVTTWAESTDRDITLVRNSMNLGATGSIFVNLDLVSTEWVTFIHQDDIYLPHHLATLRDTALGSDDGTVGVFSDMARADDDGKAIGSYPPPIWLVPDLEPPTLFLALLRNHCIPWSALAVRTTVFRETEAPWHSTAFPDTEITMRLTGRGTFVHIEKETMRYRDNLASESRSIDNRERKFGATVSLFRVFNSAEFAVLARAIRTDDRAPFVEGLRNALVVRLGDTDRARLVTAGALERLEQLWDNAEPSALSGLASIYGELGAAATTSLLDRMSAAAGGTSDQPTEVVALAPGGTERPDAAASPARVIPAFVMRGYERFGNRLPYGVRRFAARSLIRFATRGNALSAWRFVWR